MNEIKNKNTHKEKNSDSSVRRQCAVNTPVAK